MNDRQVKNFALPRPFLKWVGGKAQLLGALMPQVERAGAFGRYHEPFVGGGALFFELARLHKLGRRKAFLSDGNRNLIDVYTALRENPDRVIALLEQHKTRHSEEYFYAVRAEVPADLTERAARIIYLNKTCFNGLYRENSKGEFNTPFGRYKNPLICDAPNLRAVAKALERAQIECRPFESVLDKTKPGDLVYFDPPYHPVSKTASFTAYEKGGFGEREQRSLAEVFAKLDRRGVKVMLSNSMTPLIRELYQDFEIAAVSAKRSVNCRSDRRGPIDEALVLNF